MIRPGDPCCATLAEVLKGPGGGAEPMVFTDDDDRITMVVAMIDTPGGLAFYDHAVRYCPFCGADLKTDADIKPEATS